MLKLFENYLQNRKQRIVLNGECSEYFPIESGVPQGSVLGPLLFLIYINDLEANIKSKIIFFADDTMLLSIISDPTTTANELNLDHSTIQKWARLWKMEFNPDPTKHATEVLFTCKKTKPDHPQLVVNGQPVKRMDEQKHLGLVIDSKLSFVKHINLKIIAAKKNIGIIKNLSKYLPINVLKQMYKFFFRSHLDYCDFVYHCPPLIQYSRLGISLNGLMESVEDIQYMGALAQSARK